MSEESAEAELYYNPYRLRWFDTFVIGLVLFMLFIMPVIEVMSGSTENLWSLITSMFLVFGVLFIWGLLWGFFAWGFVARWWTYAPPFTNLVNKSRLNFIGGQHRGNTLIRIDSYVMENRPKNWRQNLGFTIKQARIGVWLIFTLLFVTVRSKWHELLYSDAGARVLEASSGFGLFNSYWVVFIVLFSPVITCALVPLFISRDSSIVAVVPGLRDFNPIGREIETRLGGLIGWGSLVLITATLGSMLRQALTTSSWTLLAEFIPQMMSLLSVSCVMVLGAAYGYRNKTHFNRVDEFNKLFIGVNDWDHDFKRFALPGGGSGVLVAPHELMPGLLEHTREILPHLKPHSHLDQPADATAAARGILAQPAPAPLDEPAAEVPASLVDPPPPPVPVSDLGPTAVPPPPNPSSLPPALDLSQPPPPPPS